MEIVATLWDWKPKQKFAGSTYDSTKDEQRLSTQLSRVRRLMEDGEWRTLQEIAVEVNGSITGLSARLRDLRRLEGRTIPKERMSDGLWRYRMVPKSIQSDTERASLGLRSPSQGEG